MRGDHLAETRPQVGRADAAQGAGAGPPCPFWGCPMEPPSSLFSLWLEAQWKFLAEVTWWASHVRKVSGAVGGKWVGGLWHRSRVGGGTVGGGSGRLCRQ